MIGHATSEQRMLRESLERFARESGGLERRRRLSTAPPGFDPAGWAQFARQGWLGAAFPEESGGYGGGVTEIAIIMEVIGQGLLLEPFLANVVLAGSVLQQLGSVSQKEALLLPMIEGRTRLTLALAEENGGYDLAACGTTLRASGDGYVLAGRKIAVLNGDSADAFLVPARIGGDAGERGGLAVAIIPRGAPGLTTRDYAMVDGTRACTLDLSGVPVAAAALLGSGGTALGALEVALDLATVAVCAEAVGAMAALLSTTVEYLKVRRQFGQPLSKNQALQHRLVDMHIALQESRVLVADAVAASEAGDAAARRKAVSAAKIQVNAAGGLIGQEAVQMHGAIGTTEECIVGHYFKRLTVIRALFGDRKWHLHRYMADRQRDNR